MWFAAIAAAALLTGGAGLVARGADQGPQARPAQTDPNPTVSALLTLQATLLAPQTPTVPPTSTPAPVAPTSTPMPLATATRRPVSPLAESLVAGLNIRSGPGSSYAVVGSAAQGQQFPVRGQSGSCAWLQIVLEDGSEGWISGSPAYTTLNVPCGRVPSAAPAAGAAAAAAPPPTATRAATPAPTARPAAPAAAPAAAAPAAAAAAPAAPGLITSFEPLGSWRRGDEPYGTLQQSTAQAQSGNAAAELRYDFPAAAGGGNYVVFLSQPALRIPADAQTLSLQVYGDGSGHYLNAWLDDASGSSWQYSFGRINHTGWAPMSVALAPSREWPNGPLGSADSMTPPLVLRALVLDGVPDGAESSGVIYLDSLGTGVPAAAAASAAGPSTAGAAAGDQAAAAEDPAAAAAPAPAPVAAGPLTGKIAFTRFNGSRNNTLIYDLATNRIVAELPNTRHPDLAGGLLLVNGEGGGAETIIRMTDTGGNPRPITSHPEDAYPQWSPSMASLAFSSTSYGDRRPRLFYQEDAGAQFDSGPMIYNKRELFGDYPIYLDNWRIAFQGCNTWAGGSKCGIYSTDTRGGEPIQATTQTADIPTGNLGNKILFTSNRSGNYDVWVVNFDGGGLQQLTDNPAVDGPATASPDYSQIAFLTSRDGVWSVYAMNVDGSNERKLFDVGGSYGSGDYEWYRDRISWGP
jgi:Tol biopolymer transport system component